MTRTSNAKVERDLRGALLQPTRPCRLTFTESVPLASLILAPAATDLDIAFRHGGQVGEVDPPAELSDSQSPRFSCLVSTREETRQAERLPYNLPKAVTGSAIVT